MDRGIRNAVRIVLQILLFAFLLYLFLLSISLMGSSFKLLGKGVAEALISSTSNPFVGLFIGVLATSIVQSSSLTTSLVVALVSGGALSVHGAVTIVMGANIGTTITNTIVSLGHVRRNDEFERAYAGAVVHDVFNLLSVAVILPIQLYTGFLDKAAWVLSGLFYGAESYAFQSPVKAIVGPAAKWIEGFCMTTLGLSKKITGILCILISLFLIFFALSHMVKFMRRVAASRVEHWVHRIFGANAYLTLLIGVVVTALIQSSSITTSMLVPMVGAGLITISQVTPMTVGANIGTTVTALLAAFAGNQAGLAIAFVHLLFNICGTLIFFVPPVTRRIPIFIAEWMAHYFVRYKKLVVVYIGGLFFLLPLACIVISRHI